MNYLRRWLSHPLAYIVILFIAAMITIFEREVHGALLFLCIISLYLIVFDDLVSAMLPFLLICTFTLKCYDSFDTFMAYKWFALPAIIAVVFHFAYYRKKITIGENFTLKICKEVNFLAFDKKSWYNISTYEENFDLFQTV